MKNLNEIAAESRKGTQIYYSIREKAVYTKDGDGRYFVTELLRENTAEEIKRAINRWLAM